MGKQKILTMMFVFMSFMSYSQNINPYLIGGASVHSIDSFNVSTGPNFGIGIMISPEKASEVYFEAYAKAEVSYRSFYGVGKKHQFVHFRGGGGLTDTKWFYLGLMGGLIHGSNEDTNSSLTMDADCSITIPITIRGEDLSILLNGSVGGAFLSLDKELMHKPLFVTAGIGLTWNLNFE